MAKTRCNGRPLDVTDDVAAIAEAVIELAERSRRIGDGSTALVAQDAAEALLALLDRLWWISRPATVREAD